MMADLRDRASSLVMNGRWWAVSSINQQRRIRECNPATRDDKFRQATVFRAKCRPLQSSDITNTNILCMNELHRWWWVVVLYWESQIIIPDPTKTVLYNIMNGFLVIEAQTNLRWVLLLIMTFIWTFLGKWDEHFYLNLNAYASGVWGKRSCSTCSE